MKTLISRATSATLVSFIAFASDAWAQAAAEEKEAQEVVVTGSRAIRDGSAAPTPVTTVTTEALTQTAPSNIPDALNRLPQFQLSANQYRSVTFNATSGLQGNYLNLRALGSQRVLVMLDGTRVPPTSSTNAVDSNILPQMLIERVDVVTGGASAAYGSDAVSGVVNYILNKKFAGVQSLVQAGTSEHGDAQSYRLGLAAGSGFANDAGHVEFSIEHYTNDGISRQDRRPRYDDFSLIVGTGTTANPFTQIFNARYNDLTFGGLVRSGPLAGKTFNPDGSVSPFVPGTPTGTSNIVVGGQGAYIPPTVLVPKLETNQAFARTSYDFSDRLGAFLQGSYGRSETSYLSAFAARRAGTSNGITMFADNPYLNPAVLTALGAAPSFTLSRLFSDAPGNQQQSITKSYNIQLGLTGKFASSLAWDASYVHGDAQLDLSQVEQNNRNFYAAIDAVRGPDGKIVCRVSLVNPSLVPGCLPLNVLGLGNLDPASLSFIRRASRSQIENELDIVAANLRGDLFALPAGALSFAVGAEARWQDLTQTSNADPAVPVDYTGIRGVPAGVLPFATTNVGSALGHQSVKEAYGELNVPLLKDKVFARRLDLNGAIRYTDYKTSGAVRTWKVGTIYEPIPDIRFRATASRDIAAPSLFDLFAGAQATILAQPDPHTGVSGPITTITAGNPDIQPERADTYVVGLVLNPSFVPRLTVSIDGYRIAIKDAIGSTDSLTELNDCERSGGTAPVCALITRPLPFSDTSPANFPTQILVGSRNLASLRVSGIDTEINYTLPLEDVMGLSGSLELRGFASYLDSYETKANATAATVERAGKVIGLATTGGLPRWRTTLQQAYRKGDFFIQLAERATSHYDRTTVEVFDPSYVRAAGRIYTDLYLSQGLANNRYTVFFKVDNLFDVDAPYETATVNPGFTYPIDKNNYDVVGRSFTAGIKLTF
jgi:iron complex outermembrane recepter protein